MSESRDTITAICTAPGDGGVAMIRISGKKAIEIGHQIFSKDLLNAASNQLIYGQFLNRERKVVDFGLIVKMVSPNSYTGEDVVEIFCHGGRLITQKVLQCALDAGARAAKPGEFTKRAYLNQKMDLSQAEAVQSLISAQNEYALKIANQQLEGQLSKKIKNLQQNLIDQAAILEAWVDFPEEGIEFCSLEEIIENLKLSLHNIKKLLETYHDGQAIKNGFSICLIGSPNVGKSSLMNQLLKKERAIVTPIAGTTRDLLEETLIIDGMQYRLIDTAGIRSSSDIIEEEGIKRAHKASKNADLILFVLDQSRALTQKENEMINELKNKKVLFIWNKNDLDSYQNPLFENEVKISAKTGKGIDILYKKISEILLLDVYLGDQIYLTEVRHKEALQKAYEFLEKVILGLENDISPEWLTFDLKASLNSLGQIIGMDITENILSNIFSKFCIGK